MLVDIFLLFVAEVFIPTFYHPSRFPKLPSSLFSIDIIWTDCSGPLETLTNNLIKDIKLYRWRMQISAGIVNWSLYIVQMIFIVVEYQKSFFHDRRENSRLENIAVQ